MTAVEDEGISHFAGHALPVEIPIVVPFGNENQAVTTFSHLAGARAQVHAHAAVFALKTFVCNGIVSFDAHAAINEFLRNFNSRSFA